MIDKDQEGLYTWMGVVPTPTHLRLMPLAAGISFPILPPRPAPVLFLVGAGGLGGGLLGPVVARISFTVFAFPPVVPVAPSFSAAGTRCFLMRGFFSGVGARSPLSPDL